MSEIELKILRIPIILFAITIHEFAHGFIAFRCGDTTARDAGRLTLNPISHLDIFGALMMFFGPFGWAKPVPVNPFQMKNPRRDLILVSLAGPVSNMICAACIGLTLRILMNNGTFLLTNKYVFVMLLIGFQLNIGLAFFNMIPIPPLDGSKVVMGFLPPSKVNTFLRIMKHAPTVLLGLLLLEWGLHIRIFSTIFDPVFNPFLDLCQTVLIGRKVM